jgi:hypothetical protein
MKYGVRKTSTGEYMHQLEPLQYTDDKRTALPFDSEIEATLSCHPFDVIVPFFEEGEDLTGVCIYCKERLADSTGLEHCCASCEVHMEILGEEHHGDIEGDDSLCV